jgi:radical SAM protein with 4Fe4S-binding SPASM domain
MTDHIAGKVFAGLGKAKNNAGYQYHDRHLKSIYGQEGKKGGVGNWIDYPFFWYLIFASYKCTKRCPYCYIFNQKDIITEMSDSDYERLCDFVCESYNESNIKVANISFLGGEPLLRTDRIKQMMDRVYQRTPGILATIFTNGDLIDQVNWDDVKDLQTWNLHITDLALEEIERRMKVINKNSTSINQTIVATLDFFNLSRIEEVTKFGMENNYRLRYYRNIYEGNNERYKEEFLKKGHAILDILENYKAAGYTVHTTFLFDTLVPRWKLTDHSPYHCGKRLMAIMPDGSISPCIRNHEYKVGTIYDNDLLKKIKVSCFEMNYRREDIPAECKVCIVRDTCQGGCPNDRKIAYGTFGGKSPFCKIHKELILRMRELGG